MMQINRLNIKLPSGFKGRETEIGRMVRKRLEKIRVKGNIKLSQLRVRNISVPVSATDNQVADTVVGAISKNIQEKVR